MRREVDVVVVGLGVMGAATLAALARRGVSAIGIERFDIPHAQGSSHGGTRIIRKAYYEDPRYVPLLHRAWEAWRELETAVGEELLLQTGGLHFGPTADAELQGVLTSVDTHALSHELLSAGDLMRRFPQFRADPGDLAVIEHEAGVLFAERCVQALVEVAQRAGATVFARETLDLLDLAGKDVVITTSRRTIVCRKVVLTLGPWWPAHAPIAAPLPLSVSRQVQFWVRPNDPEAYRPGRLPVFLRYGDDFVYGLPEAYYQGLKVAAHRGGVVASPETIDRTVHPGDEAVIRRFLARHMPGADGPLLGARVCMYTNSGDSNFALGLHPDAPQVVVGTGFSGHGFKLAPVVGEILADYAIDGSSARTIDIFDVGRS